MCKVKCITSNLDTANSTLDRRVSRRKNPKLISFILISLKLIGVSQGLNVGPLLFLMYVNELPQNIMVSFVYCLLMTTSVIVQ